MATTKKAPAPAAAKKAAPAPAPASAGVATFVMGPWPAKHQSGHSIRCYMHKVAQQLTAKHPTGFTVAQYASALAAGLAAWEQAGGKAPSTGFGTAQQPNGAARQHAQWPTRPAQGYLVPPAK